MVHFAEIIEEFSALPEAQAEIERTHHQQFYHFFDCHGTPPNDSCRYLVAVKYLIGAWCCFLEEHLGENGQSPACIICNKNSKLSELVGRYGNMW